MTRNGSDACASREHAARPLPCPSMIRRLCVMAIAVVGFGVSVPSAGAGTTSSEQRVLAVLNTAGGSFREAGDGYRLVLYGVAPRAVWFSDQPARATGSATIDELVEAFFSDDADPNAALEVFDGRRAGDVVVVELSDPRRRKGGSRLVLDARLLMPDELAATSLQAHAERATKRPPGRFGAAALYIDDAASCLFGNGGAGGSGGAGGDPAGEGGKGGTGGIVC